MRFLVFTGWLAAAIGAASADIAADEAVETQGVVAAGATGRDDKTAVYRLRYRFRANEQRHYRVTQQSTITLTKGEATGIARSASTTRKHLRVVSVDKNGNAVLEPVLDSVKMWKQHNQGKKHEYDSDNKSKPPRHFAGVSKTIGVPLVRVTVTPRGEFVKAVPILDKKAQKQVVKNNGPPKPANDASKNFLVVFPERPIRVGNSWTDDKFTVHLQVAPKLWQPFVILRKYKLLSVADGNATIRLDMVPKKRIAEPALQVQLVQRLLSGKIVFDVVRGAIVSRELNCDNKVYGFARGQSRLHVVSKRREELVRKPIVASGNASEKK